MEGEEDFNFQLVDMQGKQLYSSNQAKASHAYNAMDLPNGMYIVRIISESNTYVKTVIKQ
jgi:hypothetical protein